MARLIYTHPDDNLAPGDLVTATTFAALSAFGLANIKDLELANPVKFNGKTGAIVFDHVSAKAPQIIVIAHHNLDEGLDVRWQANASDSWGSPTFSQAVTIGAKDKDGYRPNTYIDLSGAPPNLRFNRLYIAGTNTRNVIIGGVAIYLTKRTLVHNYSWGFNRGDQRPGHQSFETKVGVEWINPSFGRRRKLEGSVMTNDPGMLALSTWSQACGGMDQKTCIIPSAPDITDAVICRWMNEFGYSGLFTSNDQLPVGWCEVARGLPWL